MIKKLITLTLFLPLLSWAAPAPETVLTQKCLTSYQTKYKNSKSPKAFVYAREEKTGKNRCQWNYGSVDVETAKNKAVAACAKYQLNAECIVVDTDGEYLVKEGDFSLITPVDKTPLTDAEKDDLVNQAKQLLTGNCLPFYKKHLNDKGHKVFSYSIDSDGKYACGKSSGGNLVSSRLKAIKACNRNKRKRGNKKPVSDCRIYAENKKILLNANDYGVTIAEKSDKSLTTDEFNALLNQSKEVIDEGPCVFQMKYYLRGSQHNAFYLATDDQGKQTCGWTEGAFTPKIAKQEALDKCKKNVKKNLLKASCTLLAENFILFDQPKSETIIEKKKDSEITTPKKASVVVKPKPVIVLTPEEDYVKAIYKGDLVKIKKYIDTGFDVNQTTKDGVSPLFIAAAKGDNVFFKKLLEKGADVKHKTQDGSNILIAATFGADVNIISDLLTQDFDVNSKGKAGYTPLHLALISKNKSLISLFLKEGADPSIKNDDGTTASVLAEELKINLDEHK